MNTNDTQKIKILVLGANGQLGQEFRYQSLQSPDISFVFYNRDKLDITDSTKIGSIFEKTKWDYVINCAAYTAVDKAESERELCFNINAVAPGVLARFAEDAGVRLIHFSTDYLYHNYDGFPLKEDSLLKPRGVYAASKLAGEEAIRATDAKCLILRTSWVISGFGQNFVKTMLRLGKEKNSIRVVHDQYGTPTYARDLARAVLNIIKAESNTNHYIESFNQTYNYSSEGITTWYEIALEIMRFGGLNCELQPIWTSEYPTPSIRPNWSVMSKQKIKQNFNLEIPHWYSALKRCLAENY